MSKGPSEASLELTKSAIVAAASDRAVMPFGESRESKINDGRTGIAPAILAGAGSDPTAANLIGDASATESSQASAAALDYLFATAAEDAVTEEADLTLAGPSRWL